jgi:FkbH-like protein
MPRPELRWLPEAKEFSQRLKALEQSSHPDSAAKWQALVSLANLRLDLLRTERLDSVLQREFSAPPRHLQTKSVRLAVLGSSTTSHLLPSIRVAALRRNIHVTVHEGEYGQYLQELSDTGSDLHRFGADVILLAFDARHVTGWLDANATVRAADEALAALRDRAKRCWTYCRDLGASVIQQTVLPAITNLVGSNEQRLAGSPSRLIAELNHALRVDADQAGVHLLALDEIAARDGVAEWHDPVLWHKAKQEISPSAAPLYGDHVGRLLAALQGRTKKCLVLDLDNTLWGGVIGDDGLEGIALGQGSTSGESFLAVQHYAKRLSQRGIVLAVCSKNDEANALGAFDTHPEMHLRRSDISSFAVNWDDKATNLRRIAQELNIGLDSLVFLDDNPFERNLIRAELPEVAVPEIPDDDSALMPGILADAGYFEAVSITEDDRKRAAQYAANRERSHLAAASTDMPSYLQSLGMRLFWQPFDRKNLSRIVQLINKTNQFTLTGSRTTEEETLALMADPSAFGLHFRLVDALGDNGIIAIVIGRMDDRKGCHVSTWVMSCRVFGRGVEDATFQVVVETARELGAQSLVGKFIPGAKNRMVAAHYDRLGFTRLSEESDGGYIASLALEDHRPEKHFISIVRGE